MKKGRIFSYFVQNIFLVTSFLHFFQVFIVKNKTLKEL